MADAGYPDGIEFTVYPSSLEPTWTPIAEVVQQQVAAAGIIILLIVLLFMNAVAIFLRNYTNKKYDF